MTVLANLRDILAAEFEIDPASIKPDAHLVDDLDLDSIDAIEILARLRQLTGKALPAESLRNVRTVGDVVRLVESS